MNAFASTASKFRFGANVSGSVSRFGVCVSGRPGGASFHHPFSPALSPSGLTFSKGLVEGFEPVIKGVPISGDRKTGQVPILKLDAKEMNQETLESFACIEVTPKEDGTLDKDALVEVVHRRDPFRADDKVGRQPIALILWDNGRAQMALSQVWFNLRYVRTTPAPGGGPRRHFFL